MDKLITFFCCHLCLKIARTIIFFIILVNAQRIKITSGYRVKGRVKKDENIGQGWIMLKICYSIVVMKNFSCRNAYTCITKQILLYVYVDIYIHICICIVGKSLLLQRLRRLVKFSFIRLNFITTLFIYLKNQNYDNIKSQFILFYNAFICSYIVVNFKIECLYFSY